MIVLATLTRILAIVGKELVETFRRPAAVFSLVIGPLILILLFGAGYDGTPRPLATIIVVPPESGLPADPAAFSGDELQRVELVDVTADLDGARRRVEAGEADLLVVAPADLADRFRAGEQSVIGVEYSIINPIRAAQADLVASQIADRANRLLVERAVAEGESYAVVAGRTPTEALSIPPAVIAEPMRAETTNLAPTPPGIITFFGPAALALVLQHLAVALIALSIVRERARGHFEMFRVAPVSATEILVGKGIAYAAIGIFVGMAILAVLIGAFGVPMLAGAGPIALGLGLTLVAALALGAFIAGVSDTERQAVQLVLLLLLASVFFSGFVLPVDEFQPLAQAFSDLLPVSHGIVLLQGSMLTGVVASSFAVGALLMLALACAIAAWWLLRRSMRAGRVAR